MMKRPLTICLAILMAVSLSIVPLAPQPVTANGTTIYVPTTDYPTIQAGIDAASPGDTVQVAAGTYYESITMKPGVTIEGSGADVTTIDASGVYFSTVVGADNSTITGFTITGSIFGVFGMWSSPTITNNTIQGNGAGIYLYSSSPTIANNTIQGNEAGILFYLSSPRINNNIIQDNIHYGISANLSSSMITNNVITGNGDVGIYLWHSSPVIINNTIQGNGWAGIFSFFESSPTITNNIVAGNEGYGILGNNSSPTISYNNVWGNAENYGGYGISAGSGDISEDPQFVNAAGGDFHLQTGSPSIDAGDNTAVPDWLTTDFEGDPRIVNGVVDMGADEYYVQVVPATIDIDPDTLNLESQGKWITCYIELPDDYDVGDIDVSTILLDGLIPAELHPTETGDYDGDGILDLMVKFDRAAVIDYLEDKGVKDGDDVELTVTGEVSATTFEESDTIKVLSKGKK